MPDDNASPPLYEVMARYLSRRKLLGGAVTATALASVGVFPGRRAGATADGGAGDAAGRFHFPEILKGIDERDHWPGGYTAKPLIRWGDPLLAEAPEFDPQSQSPEAQAQQFGYNNDYTAFFPLPGDSEDTVQKGLLCINHESASTRLMFPKSQRNDESASGQGFRVAVQQAAIGCSVVEIERNAGEWRYLRGSPYNRRITAGSTTCVLSGSAAGHDRLKTGSDPSGRRVIGTLANCAGGTTPWGTYLSAEENIHEFFGGRLHVVHPEYQNYRRMSIPRGRFWAIHDQRFNINREPLEANRFGWVVEIDPFDPKSHPVKRTALGRFKHEGAETVLSRDGRLVVYMGDDEVFEYLYKFVTHRKVDLENREANRDILDEGTLFVARFYEDGRLQWLPLVQGLAPLDADNGFANQADVLIETRRAADLLGATPMDRPEDVQPNLYDGRVYVALTKNKKRDVGVTDGANPRPNNAFGHIIEFAEADGDFAAKEANWDILVLCGDPGAEEGGALWNPATTRQGWFANPDNLAVDGLGRLWVCSDQGATSWKTGTTDGFWGLETEGELRGTGRLFYRVPVGAELCGPCFTPDSRSLFLAIQHVAQAPPGLLPGFERKSSFEDPVTRWPDFDSVLPPRPSVVVITEKNGAVIGT